MVTQVGATRPTHTHAGVYGVAYAPTWLENRNRGSA
jgi:hypothetical protein